MAPLLSVIILVYNRRETLACTVERVTESLMRLADGLLFPGGMATARRGDADQPAAAADPHSDAEPSPCHPERRPTDQPPWLYLAEIIIIDNASTDGSTADANVRFPHCRILRLEKNLGVAAFNRGVDLATGKYLLILDDDAWPAESTSDEHSRPVPALRSGEKEGRGVDSPVCPTEPACGPIAPHPSPLPVSQSGDGAREPEPDSLALALAFLESNPAVAAVMLQPIHPRTGQLEWPFDRVTQLTRDWPDLRCANLIRRKAWLAVGGYEESFFLYRNDTDLALKLLGSGRDIAYNPAWRAMHDSPHIATRRVRWFFLSTRNWCWMCRRHARYRHALAPMIMGWLWAHRLARRSATRHWAAFSGAMAGLFRPAPPAPAGLARDGRALRRLIKLKRALRRVGARHPLPNRRG